MRAGWRVWAIRSGIVLATCVGVFVVPFLWPAAPAFQGISASNLAGFNNRVAVVAAAGMALLVFGVALKWPHLLIGNANASWSGEDTSTAGERRLALALVAAVVLMWAAAVLLSGMQIIRLGIAFPGDWGYFINRASMHADFGRTLYTQIEYPYGPLLFYGPIAVRAILWPLHLSLVWAYLLTLTIEIVIGLLLVAYVIESLPMSKRWKTMLFLLLAVGMLPINMGVNYTFFRFATPLAFLAMASQRRRPWTAILWLFAGQAVCLGLSPEIGFAFFVSSFAYAAYQCLRKGWAWVPGLVAPAVSTGVFLFLAGRAYLRMVGLYAHGGMNFPVEPLPHILVFLFALVWLVPVMLSRSFRERRAEAPILTALCLVSLTLLPAAFGRCDPLHVFWNGLALLLLSGVALSSKRLWQQITWCACLCVVILWMCFVGLRLGRSELGPVLHGLVAQVERRPAVLRMPTTRFNLEELQAIVGHDAVVTPEFVPASVETQLRTAGQWTPTFYYFQVAVLDRSAEEREVAEFNESKWALIPAGKLDPYDEEPEQLNWVLGYGFPYKTRRPVYKIGLKFKQNLAENWKVRGAVGDYLVYENVRLCNGCGRGQGLAGGM